MKTKWTTGRGPCKVPGRDPGRVSCHEQFVSWRGQGNVHGLVEAYRDFHL